MDCPVNNYYTSVKREVLNQENAVKSIIYFIIKKAKTGEYR